MTRRSPATRFRPSGAPTILLALTAIVGACGRVPTEYLVYVDTDAPVPPDSRHPPATGTAELDPPWLFDSLRAEVIERPGRKDFTLDKGLFIDGTVSFGVLPDADRDLHLKLQLYRSDRLVGDEPLPDSTVETIIRLPPAPPDRETAIAVWMPTTDIGRQRGRPIAEEPSPFVGGDSQVGKWTGARVIPCGPPQFSDQTCIPGGAFLLGDPLLAGLAEGQSGHERLVIVSPFYIDNTEVTVGNLRDALPMLRAPPPRRHNDATQVVSEDAFCTYTAKVDTHDVYPVNCIAWETANAYCQLKGKELPTEAQWEFAASGFGRELGYAWGSDPPSCSDAVWGNVPPQLGSGVCRGIGRAFYDGAGYPEIGTRDRILANPVPESGIFDLAGNVAEWTKDPWSLDPAGLGAGTGFVMNPFVGPADASPHAVRGGSFTDSPVGLRAGYRRSGGQPSLSGGFRCVWTAK